MGKLRAVILTVFLAVFGVVLVYSGVSDTLKLSGEVPDFNYESMQSLKKGDFVQGYVENVIDRYASETTVEKTFGVETSSKVSCEYFIMPLLSEEDVAEDLYITVSAKNEGDRKMLNELCDITWEYIGGNTDVKWIDMPIVAKVKPLDNELKGYMTGWFRDNEWFDLDVPASDEEIESHIVPYELVIYRAKSASGILITGIVMLITAAAIAVILFIRERNMRSLITERDPASVPPLLEGALTGETSARLGSEPMPYIPQPVQPDEFFARPEKNPADDTPRVDLKKPTERDNGEAASEDGNMGTLDTSAADLSLLDRDDGNGFTL